MSTNRIVIIIVTVIVVGLGLWWYVDQRNPAPAAPGGNVSLFPETITTGTPETTGTANPPPQAEQNNSGISVHASGSVQLTASPVLTLTNSGFSPAALTVQKGDTVIFKNESNNPVWPASDPHPIHNGYATTGGCIGSTFDACRGIAPGGTWSFKFDRQGAWRYHDHLNARRTGTIIVQ